MENSTNNGKSLSRRNFFKAATVGIGAAITFLLGFPLIDSVVNKGKIIVNKTYSMLLPVKNIPNSFVPVKKPSKFNFTKTDWDAYIKTDKQEDVWVVKKPDEKLTAFSPICPHLGCRYNWNQEEELFICPCHNSVYTIDGTVVSGPAPRGLDTMPTEVKSDDMLYVLYERFELGIPEKIIVGY
jgi:Rieske Fe-S protein